MRDYALGRGRPDTVCVLRARLEMITRHAPLRRSWLKRKPRRYVVPPEILAYWEWIRKQPCGVCGSRMFVQAAHVGMRGLSQLCNGWEVIPLCRFHHDRG